MYRILYSLFFLIICINVQEVCAQNFQVTSKAQHPYRHIPNDLNADNSPTNGYYLTDKSSTNQFHWIAPGVGINGCSSTTPSSPTDSCTQGQIACDANWFYACYSSGSWVRVAMATWSATVSFILQEDGVSFILQEDGISKIKQE